MRFYPNIENYNRGMNNRETVLKLKISNKRKVKILLYNIVVMFCSPQIGSEFDRIYFVNGKSQEYFNLDLENITKISHGNVYTNAKQFFLKPTLYSIYNRWERIAILFNAVKIYKKNKIKIGDFSSWFEYVVLEYFMHDAAFNEIIARGHYDEYATWIGLLAEEKLFKYSIFQHGVEVDDVKVRSKIFCNNLFAFDKYSIEIFKKNIIKNESCNYFLHDFPPSVLFESIVRTSDLFYIGIAEQCNKDWINRILKILSGVQGICIILMLHPLSREKYKKDSRIIMTDKKILNIDLLITENSTLTLDYYRKRKDIRIIYTSVDSYNTFSEYPFILCETEKEIITLIMKGMKND